MGASSAADFFGDPAGDAAGLEKHIQESELAFEAWAVRTLLKKFGIDPRGWDVREALGDRLRFGLFDEVYPRFPVRLATRRLVARRRSAERRRNGDLGFHEVKPNVLFRPKEFAKTQVVKEWEGLKADHTVDRRPVGLVFQCVGTQFVAHDWAGAADRLDGIRLEWLGSLGGPGPSRLTVELFDTFLSQVAFWGWHPG